MHDEGDRFPTRLDGPEPMYQRIDPVVHARYSERWSGPLDETSLSRYERDGFLWFEGFFAESRLRPFLQDLAELADDESVKESDRIIRDGNGAIRSVFEMHRVSERFDALTRDPRLLGIARQLLGSDVYVHQSRVNDKGAFQGSGFNWHSDFETWHAEDGMPRMRALSVSILLTDNNEFNGPLMLIPGSHHYFVPCVGRTPKENWRKSLQQQRQGVPGIEEIQLLAHQGGITAPKGPPGSLLLFECNTLHASNANMSPWPRANLFFVYNSVENRLAEPYCGNPPRPQHLASRGVPQPLDMDEPTAPQLAFTG